ncbi:hypothetical protein TREMEDRAFT_35809, partial [Tremella mesenterica DSM 1558]
QHIPSVYNALKPIASIYANAAGHRKMGLRYDDLIIEEREDVQKAINRLPTRESYDRVFRMRRGILQSAAHKHLSKEEWVKPEEDVRYLAPIVEQVAKEDAERAMWDSMAVERKK